MPCGDQQPAIDSLVQGITDGVRSQVLLGVTGSGKTFTIANLIAAVQKPTLIVAHNKTLAAQLYQEFASFFPNNAVEYFVSYYDYYQPEAYVPRTDTYIEKDSAINERIEKMRLSATRSLLERRDVIIVASVSCIYGLGLPEYYRMMNMEFVVGEKKRREEMLFALVQMQYERSDMDLQRSTFRVRGDTIDIFPAYEDDVALRIEFFDETVESINLIDPLTAKRLKSLPKATLYAGSHHVTPLEVKERAIVSIREEMLAQQAFFLKNNRFIEAQRVFERVTYDLELLKEVGTCKGVENYSRHFSQRKPGDPPPCLIEYFPKDFLVVLDESHQTVPQLSAMCHGDRARKTSLIEYGFRLPSAYDNRPLNFDEFSGLVNQIVYVSATPAPFEIKQSSGVVVEQILRPTGLLDPLIEIKKASTQIDSCLEEIRIEIQKGGKILVTALTKKLAEEISVYLSELGVKARYMHSDIDVIERLRIVHDLRTGVFDVLIGINLLREGLDIPEVSLIAILDADKLGFLRSQTSLIQICGRAARNENGRVIMYADTVTQAMSDTIAITSKRREKQIEYNKEHNITPKTIRREAKLMHLAAPDKSKESEKEEIPDIVSIRKSIKEWEDCMKKAAREYRFEDAAHARDIMKRLQQLELEISA